MDTKRWKSVLLPREVYDELVVVAHTEGRTISGQLRIVFDSWKESNLSHNDKKYIAQTIEEKRIAAGIPPKEFQV